MIDDYLLRGYNDKLLKLWDSWNREIIINKEKTHPGYIT